MKSGIKITIDKLPDIMRALKALETKEVLIGVPDSGAERESGSINNAGIGYLNEHGGVIHHPGGTRYIRDAIVGDVRKTLFVGRDFKGETEVTKAHTITIPARPHLVPGVEDVNDRAARILGQAAKAALSGNPGAVDKAFNAVGILGQNSVRNKIRSNVPPPLAKSTLAKRRSIGARGETPLLRTGEYMKSITYVVRKKER